MHGNASMVITCKREVAVRPEDERMHNNASYVYGYIFMYKYAAMVDQLLTVACQ